MKIYYILLCLFFTSCTINIVQTDTHGVAEDVVDTDPSNDVKADADLSLEGHTI